MKKRARDLVVDAPGSFGARSRARRWETFAEVFPHANDMSIVDLGGTVEAWRRAPVHPGHVTVLNLYEPGEAHEDWITPVAGDACDPPADVSAGHYDLVFSNSLIEHVGGHARRLELAETVRGLAAAHWVQTPNRYFPIEPHYLFPGLQFLPLEAQARLVRRWPLVHSPPPDMESARNVVQWTELVGPAQMRTYFPESRLVLERVLGLSKSLIAVKTT